MTRWRNGKAGASRGGSPNNGTLRRLQEQAGRRGCIDLQAARAGARIGRADRCASALHIFFLISGGMLSRLMGRPQWRAQYVENATPRQSRYAREVCYPAIRVHHAMPNGPHCGLVRSPASERGRARLCRHTTAHLRDKCHLEAAARKIRKAEQVSLLKAGGPNWPERP